MSQGSFLRLIDTHVSELDRHSDALRRIHTGELAGVLVRGLYEPQELAPIVERLERHDPPFLKTWFPKHFKSWFFGRNLDLADPDNLEQYFAEADDLRAHLGQLFRGNLCTQILNYLLVVSTLLLSSKTG